MGTIELEIDSDERHGASSGADFALAHLSDLHLSSLEGVRPLALLGKRILGYITWRQRRVTSTGPTCWMRSGPICTRNTSTTSR